MAGNHIRVIAWMFILFIGGTLGVLWLGGGKVFPPPPTEVFHEALKAGQDEVAIDLTELRARARGQIGYTEGDPASSVAVGSLEGIKHSQKTPGVAGARNGAPSVVFRDVTYFHRYHVSGLFEFTPAGEENLETWKHMISIIENLQATTPATADAFALSVRDKYVSTGGTIVVDNLTPASGNTPARRTMVAAFPIMTKDSGVYWEVIFTTISLTGGRAVAVVYSERIRSSRGAEDLNEFFGAYGGVLLAEVEAFSLNLPTVQSLRAVPQSVPGKVNFQIKL
ncbi:MAG: hypothetical protein AAB421_04645 [Patescibacteria group bacterium]